jgi:CheY-like chemotaxis protein
MTVIEEHYSCVGEAYFLLKNKEYSMSSEARTVLIVTDDPSFSALVSDLMLRAGIRTIHFARNQEALKLTRQLMPDLVLIHRRRDGIDLGHACYEILTSDSKIACIPILLYTSPLALGERAVGAPATSTSTDRLNAANVLIGQISTVLGVAPHM